MEQGAKLGPVILSWSGHNRELGNVGGSTLPADNVIDTNTNPSNFLDNFTASKR